MINDHFKTNIIASIKLNEEQVPGLSRGEGGPFVFPQDLRTITDHVYVNVDKNNNRASHARPTMLAFLSGFVSNVRMALKTVGDGKLPSYFNDLENQVKLDFAEWQGLTAAVALNWIYSGAGLKLSVESVSLSNENPVERCILMEMEKDFLYRKAVKKDANNVPVSGSLFYICQNGTPFALYHPEICIVPMHTYDSSIFQGILPWFSYNEESCHKGWSFLAEPGKNLDEYVRENELILPRIAYWAKGNCLTSYVEYITSRQLNSKPLEELTGLSSAEFIPGAEQINNVWPGAGTNFCTTLLFYQDAAGRPSSLPEIFCDQLLISSMGEGNQMCYNTPSGKQPVCFSDGVLKGHAPVPPMTAGAMNLLTLCSMTDLTFKAEMQNTRLCSVTVSATLKNTFGEDFTIRKVFGANRMLQGRLPYLMLWPFMEMPKGFWKRYYATWTNQLCDFIPLEGQRVVTGISFDFEDQGTFHDVSRHSARDQFWTVCNSDKPFRYAKVTGKIDGERLPNLGVVIMPEYPFYEPTSSVTSPVEVAIDFGTTSTVCALKSPLLGTQILTYKDYSCGVTCVDSKAKSILDEEHWLGSSVKREGLSSKIFTVSQLFDRTRGGGPNWTAVKASIPQEYYVDSRMFLISGKALTSYTVANGSSMDPLRDQHIMNDIKFDETLDPKNHYAVSAFLSGIYAYAVLFLLEQKIFPKAGIPYLDLRISYPNEVTLNALRTGWRDAQTIAGQLMDASLTTPIATLLQKDKFYTEAAATMAYQRGDLGGEIRSCPSIISVDIGGGTTDISIINSTRGAEVRSMSLRYAGREIMVSTLIEYFRKFSASSLVEREGLFKSIWSSNDSAQMQDQFFALCNQASSPSERKLLSKNNSVRMIVEMLLSGGMKLPDEPGTSLLRQLIALKFILIMRLTARVVRENIGILDPQKNLVGGKLSLSISISGTSAQMMQYVFNCNMDDLKKASKSSANPKVAACVDLFTQLFKKEMRNVLSENIGVELQFYVRPDVFDKREVAFGMLEDSETNIFAAKPLGEIRETETVTVGTPTTDDDKNRKAAEKKMKSKLLHFSDDELQEYLNGKEDDCGVMQYILAYEKLFPVATMNSNMGLGSHINSASSLLKYFNDNLASQARFNVSNSLAKYMIEKEHKPYVTELACTYLIEDMLDSAIAELQE